MNWLIFCFLEDFIFCAYYTGLSHIMYIYIFFLLLLSHFHAVPFLFTSNSVGYL